MVPMEMSEKYLETDGGPVSLLHQRLAKARMPLPASKITHSFSVVRISRQGVLPPNFRFSIWGVGVEPRTPQNLSRTFTPSIKRPFWHEPACDRLSRFVISMQPHKLRGLHPGDSETFRHRRSAQRQKHSAFPAWPPRAIVSGPYRPDWPLNTSPPEHFAPRCIRALYRLRKH